MIKRRLFFAIAVGCFYPLCLFSQTQPTDTLTNKTHQLRGIEVVSSSTSDNVKSTLPAQSISGNTLQVLGVSQFSDAVKMLAGANVKDYGGIGGLKTVSVRSLGTQQTGVSYDGIIVGNSQAGQVDISQFSLYNVRMVSLFIGQSSDIMQPARSYAQAGVLSIESERPYFNDNNSTFSVVLRAGSFGLISPSFRYWQHIDNQTFLSVNANILHADGVYPFLLTNDNLITHEKRYNSDVNSHHIEANLYHTFRDSSYIATKAYYYYSDRGLPGAVILYNNSANERLWNESFFIQTTYHKDLSEALRLAVNLKYNHAWDRYVDTSDSYSGGKETDINRQDEYYSSATIGYNPLSNLSLALAQDAIFNKLMTNIDDRKNPLRFTSLSNLSVKYTLNRLVVAGNVLSTFVTEHLRVDNPPKDRYRLSPSASLSYKLLDNENLYFRLMYKSTFRIPTFNELYYQRFGNINLRPENAREYGGGLTYCSRKIGIINHFTLTADAYYNSVTDKIVAFPSTYLWRMVNFGKVHITGIDFTMNTNIILSGGITMDINASYTLQKAIDVTDKSTVSYGLQLPYTPTNSGSGSVILNTKWVNIGYTVIASGKTYSMVQHLSEYIVNAYADHSVSLSKSFRINRCVFQCQATLFNIFNKQYEIIKYYPMPGRHCEFSTTIKF